MTKTKSISKKLKISKAQQNVMLAVLGASIVLGVSAVLVVYFMKVIKFNSIVINEKDSAVQSYSDLIKDVGICEKPRKKVYDTPELERCDPNEVKVGSVPGTLRNEVLVTMAQNTNLESVARESLQQCYSSTTRKKYTYSYWNDKIENASSDDLRNYYMQMIGLCSALRVIPDALPASENELALMASLDKIFEISSWTPEALSPGDVVPTDVPGLYGIELNLSVEADNTRTMTVLNNIEKSIREFNINAATIEWSGDRLLLGAKATAFYTEKQDLVEETETITGDGTIKKGSDSQSTGVNE